jgi:hypothetical protein
MEITKNEALLIAHLLDMAADKFGDHGCTDFDLNWVDGADWTLDEMSAMAESFHREIGDPGELEEWTPTRASTWLEDHCLMLVMAQRLREGSQQ